MTVELGWSEVVVLGLLILLGTLTTALKIVRIHADEIAEFVLWWRRLRKRLKSG